MLFPKRAVLIIVAGFILLAILWVWVTSDVAQLVGVAGPKGVRSVQIVGEPLLNLPASPSPCSSQNMGDADDIIPCTTGAAGPACPDTTSSARSALSTGERISNALSKRYTHNTIGWKPITTCRNSYTVKRVLSIPGVDVSPTVCDVTYPGTSPLVPVTGAPACS
jgi:hypothetical protein